MKEILPGVFLEGKKLYTRNLAKGVRHFDEQLVMHEGVEYRNWDPRSSKLATVILKGMKPELNAGSKVLYLGSAHGYTVSYVSDVVRDGFVFAIDFAPRVVRDLVFVAEARPNMAVILADASRPESYYHLVSAADFVYQDIAQRHQVKIFLRNISLFLRKGGTACIAVKSRSIDSVREPKKIFAEVRKALEAELRVIDSRLLEPYQKDHCMFLCRRK